MASIKDRTLPQQQPSFKLLLPPSRLQPRSPVCALLRPGGSLMMLNEPSLLLPPSRLQSRSPLCALLPGRARFRVLVPRALASVLPVELRRPRRPPRFLPQVHAKFQGLVAAQTAPAASAPDDGSGRLTGQMTAPAASPDDGWSRSTSVNRKNQGYENEDRAQAGNVQSQ